MNRRSSIVCILILFSCSVFSQNPYCPSPYVYMDGGANIKVYDPTQPPSATNPSNTSIPAFGSGLTLMPNINGGTLSPTFYSTFGGNYYYWNGTSWFNTGHSTGNTSAVNLGGCNGKIYNLVGGTGVVYVYDGTQNGYSLTTIPNFSGGGPYDLVTDCNCNFYALNTTTPNQSLSMYNAAGQLQCTYTLSGMPSSFAGGGFAIIGNMIYVRNSGFYIGTIGGSSVSFTSVPSFTYSPGDFASCPVCNPATNLNGISISSSILSCIIPTTGLVVTTTATPVSYLWNGPSILGSNTNSAVIIAAPGVYSCVVAANTCPPTQITLTTAVISTSVNVLAQISPAGGLCMQGNGPITLSVAHNYSTDAIAWTGSAIPPIFGSDTINISMPGSYTVSVTDMFSGCVNTDVVTVAQTPTLGLALSDNTLCALNTNGSPASITITASGATTYTFLTSGNYTTNAPNGPVMPCGPVNLTGNFNPSATGTLIGKTAFCADTITTAFTIIPNPTVTLSSNTGSVCPQGSIPIVASGANNYLWSGSPGLNSYTGANVISTPSALSVYSVVGDSFGCKGATTTVTVAVLPIPFVGLSPPSSTICLGSAVTLTATGTATSFSWTPPAGLSATSGQTVNAFAPYTVYYTVVGSLNTCTNAASALVTVVQPPVIALSLNTQSICSQGVNNSPNSVNMFPSGAASYTLSGPGNVAVINANGPVMQVIPSGPQSPFPNVMTVTLTGASTVCKVAITRTFEIIPNPVLSISPSSASVCPGQTKSFFASGANSYTWLPAQNYTVSSPNSIVASPLLSSFYSVIGNSNGCNSAIKNAVLVILPVPQVSINPGTATVCAGSSATLSIAGNASSYQWSPALGLSSTTGTNVVSTLFTTQEYTVLATMNTCTNMALATVSAIVIPVITASTKQPTICSGASTNLNVIGATTYNWFPAGDLNFSSGNAVIASPNSSTTYTVHGYNGICTGSTSIYVHTVKRPDMNIVAPYSEVCLGQSVPINVKGAQSYVWSPRNGIVNSAGDSLIVVAPQVNTNYSVVGANSVGSVSCYQQISYSVIVVPYVIPAVSPSVSLCIGDKATLHASGGNTFSWTPGEGLNVTDKSGVVANPKVYTIYTVHVSHNGYCGNSTTVEVNVNPRPQVYAGRDTTFNLSDAIFIKANGTGTLTWMYGDGIWCLECPETQVYPLGSSCYGIQAVNDYGCVATDDVCLVITEDFTIYIPNTFTPNNDGLNDVFHIYGENISNVILMIYDRWGEKVFSSMDYKVGWDGSFKGKPCEIGTYSYVISYRGLDRRTYTKTGFIAIER